MNNDAQADAEILDELLPEVIRALFPGSDSEPLSELPISQLRVMRLLWKAPTTSTDLAETLSISAPAVAQVLAKLEAADLIVKECQEHDRRTKTIELSEAGDGRMKERRILRTARAAQVLQAIDSEDRGAVIEALRKLARSARKPSD